MTPEEAKTRATEYMESWGYKDVDIYDCHEETEKEKYSKQPVEQTEYPYKEKVSVPDAPPDFGELF